MIGRLTESPDFFIATPLDSSLQNPTYCISVGIDHRTVPLDIGQGFIGRLTVIMA
jgi:hypothetical protein